MSQPNENLPTTNSVLTVTTQNSHRYSYNTVSRKQLPDENGKMIDIRYINKFNSGDDAPTGTFQFLNENRRWEDDTTGKCQQLWTQQSDSDRVKILWSRLKTMEAYMKNEILKQEKRVSKFTKDTIEKLQSLGVTNSQITQLLSAAEQIIGVDPHTGKWSTQNNDVRGVIAGLVEQLSTDIDLETKVAIVRQICDLTCNLEDYALLYRFSSEFLRCYDNKHVSPIDCFERLVDDTILGSSIYDPLDFKLFIPRHNIMSGPLSSIFTYLL